MNPRLFVDTWGWLVLANQKEEVFPAVQNVYQRAISGGCRIITSDYILDEVITFLFSKAPFSLGSKYLQELFASVGSNHIQLERINLDRFEKAWKMRLKYRDKPKISFTDFTSFVVMQELKIQEVLTENHHFDQINLGFQKTP